MLTVLGYLFLCGMITLHKVERCECSTADEVETIKDRLKVLEQTFAGFEKVMKQNESMAKLLSKALKSEKMDRINLTKLERQFVDLHDEYRTTINILKEQTKTISSETEETKRTISIHSENFENKVQAMSKAAEECNSKINASSTKLNALSLYVDRNAADLSKIHNKHAHHVAAVQDKFKTIARILGKCGSNPNQGWLQHGNKCYYFSFETVTWHEANERCQSMHAYLVKIENEEENVYLSDLVEQERVCYRTSNTYKGTMSTTHSGVQCQRWDSQTPHKHIYDERNLFPDGKVSDAANYCRDPNKDDKPNKPWCFTVGGGKTFEECSVPRCNEQKKRGTILWIGLNDITKEGNWTWAADQLFPAANTFTNWDEYQPDNSRDNEDCVVIRTFRKGKWNDGPCGERCGFICETPYLPF